MVSGLHDRVALCPWFYAFWALCTAHSYVTGRPLGELGESRESQQRAYK